MVILSLYAFSCLIRKSSRHFLGLNRYSQFQKLQLEIPVKHLSSTFYDYTSIHSGIIVVAAPTSWLKLLMKHLPATFSALLTLSFIALIILKVGMKYKTLFQVAVNHTITKSYQWTSAIGSFA